MINGMTGFGSTQFSWGRVKGVMEVKSQNHRYLDAVFFLPIGFAALENKMRPVVAKKIERGRVTISLKIMERSLQKLEFNKEVIKEYLRAAKGLKQEFGISDTLLFTDVVKLPGVVEAKEISIDIDELWPAMEKALLSALNSLMTMRKREGRSLFKDVSGVLLGMRAQLRNINSRSKVIHREQKQKLSTEEFLSFQKGTDINEEITRLTHYIDEFKLLLKTATGVGKKLDFVAQEMQRETNTIGSKLQDKIVSNAVIAIKSKIEKLREQAQNIE